MPWFKLLASTTRSTPGLRNREDYAELWSRLRETFPCVFGAVIMPDHVHMAIAAASAELARAQFAACLGAFARSRGFAIWAPVKPPESISNAKHLARMIRYIHLNPPRDKLVHDPLSWEWSTHRDAMGAVGDPWIDLVELRRLVGGPPARMAEAFHKYVSSDPDVEVGGTPAPRLQSQIVATLPSIRSAQLAAMRLGTLPGGRPPQARRIFVHLARRVGCPSRAELAAVLGVTPKTVSILGAQPLQAKDERVIQAALLILSDPRMLSPLVRPI